MTMRPVYLTLTPTAEDTDGLANNVTAASGAAFTLITDETPDGLAHKIVITPSGSVTGSYTISGLDADGFAVSETLATATTNPVTSVKFYASDIVVTAPSGLGAETVDIGWADEFASRTIATERYLQGDRTTVQVGVTGTIGFDVEVTASDLLQYTSPPPDQADYVWLNDANFTAKSASLISPLASICNALRVVVNSYSTGASLSVAILTPK